MSQLNLLIKNLKRDITDVTQPWYADYAGELGMFAIPALHGDRNSVV